jgi:putative restriction endonuclease
MTVESDESMTEATDYIPHFTRLNRAPGAVWSEATKRKAPHKPILLLAVLDLVLRGVITSPFIDVTGDLVELNELFNLYWRRILPLSQSSSIAFPFSRLDREPFWELVPQPGKTITPAIINNTSSVTYLRKYALGAHIDEGLFRIMQSGRC